ncbi:amidase [Streptomyces actinomycinicus]|uniref:Amidase n=1 Tax=Streptomyces actinomycinicus TaxID=1695166 RepID=A0A937EKN5_9ACTN|nr:amidase family protein [Streptomyces actinomycinicus]MBL1084952.1 amidase [Streptomyces actinomycinicus]
MTDRQELAWLDAHDQAELIRTGRIGADELAEAAIERIEATQATVGAVPITDYERARKQAGDPGLRRTLTGPEPPGPLAGVPFLLKDLGAPCAGLEATQGSGLLAGFVPDQDSTLVERFKAGGLLILGRSNSAEFGVLPTTEPRGHGPTRNPWDLGRSAGGSSGGAAAAVAAGLVPVAHANDAGGSIRIPAACCGVFGLKPTRARTPLGPQVGDLMNGLASEHVVSRSVRDSAAALDLIAGPAPGDPYPAPPAPGPFRDALAAPPRPLRIAFTTRAGTGPLDATCAEAVREAARLCADLGHTVTEDAPAPTMPDVADAFLDVWAAGVSSAVTAQSAVAGRTPAADAVEELTWSLYERGRSLSAAHYLLRIGHLQRAARALAAFHDSYDVLLSAVTASPPPPLGFCAHGTPEQQLDRALAFAHETPLANLTGQPAMSVPLHHDAAGLPVGVQFTGRYGDEHTLLALAAQLEQARPWAQRRPPLTRL